MGRCSRSPLLVSVCISVILFMCLWQLSYDKSVEMIAYSGMHEEEVAISTLVGDIADSRPLGLSFENKTMNNVRIYFRTVEQAKGVLFLFHGCSHHGEDWFTLPQGIQITKEAYHFDLNVVAFSSQTLNPNNHCWNAKYGENNELDGIVHTMEDLIIEMQWQNLPKHILGVSNGAEFASMIPKSLEYPLSSLLLYINPGKKEVFNSLAEEKKYFPKTAFVSLTQDQTTDRLMQQRKDREGLAAETFSINTSITFLQSETIFSLLHDNEFIDDNGFPLQNPKSKGRKWFSFLLAYYSDPSLIETKKLHLFETMNVAFGFHEVTAQRVVEILSWAVAIP